MGVECPATGQLAQCHHLLFVAAAEQDGKCPHFRDRILQPPEFRREVSKTAAVCIGSIREQYDGEEPFGISLTLRLGESICLTQSVIDRGSTFGMQRSDVVRVMRACLHSRPGCL